VSDARVIPVPEGLDGERVDAAISRLFGLSRTKAADLVGAGGVMVNERPVLKSDRVRSGDMLDVELPSAADNAGPTVVAEPVPGLGIVYDDTEIVVVDKPSGVAAHPSVGWSGPDVLGGLAAAGYRISTSGAPERQGIVSRLDVGTSGLMVVCKSETAYSKLKRAFKTRSVDKEYHALVQGLPDPHEGTVEAPIGRHPGHDYKFAVMDSGRHAVTHYELVEAFRYASLLKIHLETGRTHQIRVHFAAVHHPCVGDLTYGADPRLAARLGLTRQWLHASGLSFEHPGSGEWVSFTSAFAPDLQEALERISR
jgi:23S rRNA pseudouridine1911/1915/1917 synthase